MRNPASTRPSLLIRIRDPGDADAWRQFVSLYRPLIYRFARKQGLQDADAADLTQIVLQAVIDAIKRLQYDPQRGSFRSWLYKVVRNQLSKFRDHRQKLLAGPGGSHADRLLHEITRDHAETTELWDREFERQMFLWASDRVKIRCEAASWQAFWQAAVEGRNVKEIAKALGMSVGAVYTAKSRILDRIRKELEEAEGTEPFFPWGDGDAFSELS